MMCWTQRSKIFWSIVSMITVVVMCFYDIRFTANYASLFMMTPTNNMMFAFSIRFEIRMIFTRTKMRI
mgnify:CR=1 FL=1